MNQPIRNLIRLCGLATVALVILLAFPVSAAPFMIDLDAAQASETREAVLFPFDNYSVPFRHGLQLELITSSRYTANPVLKLGGQNDPDGESISYYGTVIKIGDQLRMWYLARGKAETTPLRVCYAVSSDGFLWEKPSLGLVSYAGTTSNNLVDVDFGGRVMSCNILHEPDDPDPARRFKMFCEVESEQSKNQGCVAFSADGLRWKTSPGNPVTHVRIENTGLIKRDGCYYVNGQNAGLDRAFQKRVLFTLASYDFEHWTDAGVLGFRRDDVPPRPVVLNYQVGPQVHLGAGLWDRGNVILGFYGQWNAPLHSDDRRDMRMDIGLLVSADGLHYHEPIPDFKIIEAREEGWPGLNPAGDPPRQAQGQGVVNLGEKTVTYYSIWGSGGGSGIRAAWWRCDRLGYFHATRMPVEGQTWVDAVKPHFISVPMRLPAGGAKVFLNASHLSEHARVAVEILDEQFQPLDAFTSADCKPFCNDSAFRMPVQWKSGNIVKSVKPVRVRVNYDGLRLEDARIYAVYIEPVP
jgi:hypothetical protein